MQDVEGQVFYGDDPLERSVRIVLEKQPRAGRSLCIEAGDEDDLAGVAASLEADASHSFKSESGPGKVREEIMANPAVGEGVGHVQTGGSERGLARKPQERTDAARKRVKAETGRPEASNPGGGSKDTPAKRIEIDDTDSEKEIESPAEPLEIPANLVRALRAIEKPSASALRTSVLKDCFRWINDSKADGSEILARPRAGGSRNGARLDVKREDLRRFDGNGLLNDVDIEAMIGLIASEAERQGHDACFFSSLFFTKLLMEGVSPSVLRWIKGQGLQPHAQNGFFVVNVNQNHWVLVHALPSAPRPTLAVYDSAKSLSAGVDHQIVESVKGLYHVLLGINLAEWEVTVPDCSQQGTNRMDCGVFCLHFLRCLALGREDLLPLTIYKVHHWRKVMPLEILRGQLFRFE